MDEKIMELVFKIIQKKINQRFDKIETKIDAIDNKVSEIEF
jgi:hypothetical protein